MRRLFATTSIRSRLTLWSVGVLALALAGCALAVHFTVRNHLLGSIDSDLASEARVAFVRETQTQVVYRHLSGATVTDIQKLPAPLPLPVYSERHRFMMVRLQEGQGSALPPLPGIDLPHRSTWEQQFRLAQNRACYATLDMDGQPWRVYTMPQRVDGKTVGMAQVAYPLLELNALLRGLDGALLALIPPALLLAGWGSAFLTGRALRPVGRMTRAAMEVEAHDLSRRLPVTGGDELGELATTFNGMFGRLEAAFAQLEDSVERQRRFTADASHELRTPLTTMRANADWALRRPRTQAEYQEALLAVVQAADRTDQLIERLLFLARSDSGRLPTAADPQSLHAILQRVMGCTPSTADAASIEVELPASLPDVAGDAEQLERLFANLLQNALRHTPPDGRIRFSACATERDVTVRVEDTGEGIPAEHLPHVCERFYRADAARSRPGGGAGLGLAICRSIVEAHGGALWIESAVGQGTTVSVRLPQSAI
jgi:heavy metal sensor kinase